MYEDFEQLKKTVGDFFQNGPLGDIRVYWYMIYPYKDGEDHYLDKFSKADVRKNVINFLYDKCFGKRQPIVEKTEALIGEIWDYGLPDKEQERDVFQALAWDTTMLLKTLLHWYIPKK